jgi:hypothetical protein
MLVASALKLLFTKINFSYVRLMRFLFELAIYELPKKLAI